MRWPTSCIEERKSAVVRVDVRDVGADDLFVATGTLRFALMSGDAAGSGWCGPRVRVPRRTLVECRACLLKASETTTIVVA